MRCFIVFCSFAATKLRETAQKSPQQDPEIGCRGRKYETGFILYMTFLVMTLLKQVLYCSFDLTKKFCVLLLLGVESDAFADFGQH
ncbi:MAG: hypothetical protein IJ901_00820, partial [Bacteroidaceae bacterium]|nr:hypothetical protein [Bacteroidaceae bacterium]